MKKKTSRPRAIVVDEGSLIRKEDVTTKVMRWIAGEREGYLIIPRIPTLYLARRGDIDTYSEEGEEYPFEKILQRYSETDPLILSKLIVFEDLSKRGYYISTDLEGNVLKVMTAVTGKEKYTLFVLEEGGDFPIDLLIQRLRTSSTPIIIGIVERRGGITYYSLENFLGGDSSG